MRAGYSPPVAHRGRRANSGVLRGAGYFLRTLDNFSRALFITCDINPEKAFPL
jgi:hypothetical protein